MAHLSSLSLENFRTFRERAEFDFAPLTILTGPNSSGKSSIFKALLLLQENVRGGGLGALDFTGGEHQLGSFESVLNNQSDEESITFGISLQLSEEDVFHCEGFDGERREVETGVESVHYELTYRLSGQGEPRRRRLKIGLGEETRPLFSFEVSSSAEVEGGTLISHERQYSVTVHGERFFDGSPERAEQVLSAAKRVTGVDEACEKIVGPLQMTLSEQANSPRATFISTVERACRNWSNQQQSGEGESSSEGLSSTEAVRRVLVDSYLPYLKEKLDDLEDVLKRCDHTGAERVTMRRFYGAEANQWFKDALEAFIEVHKPGRQRPPWIVERRGALKTWLQEFGIGDRLEVNRVADAGYTVAIHKDGHEQQLADLGYGVTQLLPLILGATTSYRSSSTLLVEEPEANLHPNLQSKLADLLISVVRREKPLPSLEGFYYEYHGRAIVETHSEYLIRRLQHLVAKGDLDREKVVIYYLGPDPEADDYIRRIEITESGQLSQQFGSGFFDEATNLMTDLYKYGSQN
jgi:predicted ATPase